VGLDQIRCHSIHEVPHVTSDLTSSNERGDLVLNLLPDVLFNLYGYLIRITSLPHLEMTTFRRDWNGVVSA
jgi:uncharacterized membrane protein